MYVFDKPNTPSSNPHSSREHTAHAKFWLKPNMVKVIMLEHRQNSRDDLYKKSFL